MKSLELKVPPLGIVLMIALSMWLASWLAPVCRFVLPAQQLIADGAAIAGAIVCSLGVIRFRRTKTTVNPMKPESASSLVVSGVYRFTRNPMYLGMLLILVGWAIFLSNALSLLFLPAFVLYMNRFQIGPEEHALEARFPEEYAKYRSRVRRWL